MHFLESKSDIDFVILWVDGNDPDWLAEFHNYTSSLDGDKRKSRFRDWDNLKYIFRSFEQCTPWVRKIHFVTWGHVPKWLDVSHEKINIVRHEDFLVPENLPVFNCNPIEINLHRIPGLAEKFVYFNDDMFVLKKMPRERFFKNGLPRDVFAFNAIADSMIANIKINNVKVMHRHFAKYEVLKKNFFKIFNIKYNPIEIMKTILLLPWPSITGFFDPHIPQPFLRSTFEEVWAKENSILMKTSASRVRNCADVSQYLFRYWHLCQGRFCPVRLGKRYVEWIDNYNDAVKFRNHIASGRYSMACINDAVVADEGFEKVRDTVNQGFETIFPFKSSFEK